MDRTFQYTHEQTCDFGYGCVVWYFHIPCWSIQWKKKKTRKNSMDSFVNRLAWQFPFQSRIVRPIYSSPQRVLTQFASVFSHNTTCSSSPIDISLMKCQNHLKPFSFEAPDNFLSNDVSFAHFTLLSKELHNIKPLDRGRIAAEIKAESNSGFLKA